MKVFRKDGDLRLFLTQRGVKIKLPVEVGFSYIGRLYPKKKATDIFKTVEGLESITGLMVYLALFICLVGSFGWIETALAVFVISIVFPILSSKAYLVVVSKIGYFFSLLPFKPLILSIYAYFIGGIMTVVYALAILFLAFTVEMLTESIFVHKIMKEDIGAAEIMFFTAVAYHSKKLGYDIETILSPITEEDISNGIWIKPFREYAEGFPKSVDYRDVSRADDYYSEEYI